jgi:competence protein ComGC
LLIRIISFIGEYVKVKIQEKNKQIKLQPFSLIEMFAVMVLVSFIMLICFTMIWSTQEVFSSTTDHNKIFSDVSRVFNMMSRDLQSSLYEKDKISFWHTGKTKNVAGKDIGIDELNFIAVRDSSKICEIHYRVQETESNSSVFYIQRSMRTPKDHKWNFYGKQLTDSEMYDEWFNNLMKNVTELKFTCFREDGSEITPSPDSDTEYPFSVKIDIKCMTDQAAFKYNENKNEVFKKENERKFSKTIYLGNRK